MVSLHLFKANLPEIRLGIEIAINYAKVVGGGDKGPRNPCRNFSVIHEGRFQGSSLYVKLVCFLLLKTLSGTSSNCPFAIGQVDLFSTRRALGVNRTVAIFPTAKNSYSKMSHKKET